MPRALRSASSLTAGTYRWACLVVFTCAVCAPSGTVSSQTDDLDILMQAQPQQGEATGSPEEFEAWSWLQRQKFIRARELAQATLKKNPRAYVARLVLAMVYAYREANFPRALYHLNIAREDYETHGATPTTGSAWKWHPRILRELASVHNNMEHFTEALQWMDRFNSQYQPQIIAEKAWPLMKLRRFDDARRAAAAGLAEGSAGQRSVALNALCAIEFEAGNDEASYTACKAALDDSTYGYTGASAVDYTNFAEAARALLRLDEAEQATIKATEAVLSWYGNPWIELTDLYVRQARFAEAWSALQKAHPYRARRPPHVQITDRAETRRAMATFLMTMGKSKEALRRTEQALRAPDRRAHNSRNPMQDRAIIALLDRRVQRMEAERLMEQAAADVWWKRPWYWAQSLWLRYKGWQRGKLALSTLTDPSETAEHTLLEGIFQIGTSKSAITPPWMIGDLTELVESTLARQILHHAKTIDPRPRAHGHYKGFLAEVEYRAGNPREAHTLLQQAIPALAEIQETLMQARMNALQYATAMQLNQPRSAGTALFQAYAMDPGIFRRLELAIPIHSVTSSDDLTQNVAHAILRSPRFDSSPRFQQANLGFALKVSQAGPSLRCCLMDRSNNPLACSNTPLKSDQSPREIRIQASRDFHDTAFAPALDLSLTDINSLEGSNQTQRDTLNRTPFGDPPAR